MRLTYLPFLLLIVPLLEISIFIVVGGQIGPLWTIGMVLFTAILGSILLRIEGFRTFAKIKEKMDSGQIPGEELGKGAMILVAGVLLLTPGFLTDTIGFALFLPFVRKLIWVFLSSRFKIQNVGPDFSGMNADNFRQRNADDGDVVELDPDDFHEKENADSPWFNELDDKRKND